MHTSAAHPLDGVQSAHKEEEEEKQEGQPGASASRPVLANAEHLTHAFTPARVPGWVQHPEACPPAARSHHHIFFQCFPRVPVSVFLPTDSYLQNCLASAVLVRKGGCSSEPKGGGGVFTNKTHGFPEPTF